MKKKIIATVLTATMLFSIAGCRKNTSSMYEDAFEKLGYERLEEYDLQEFSLSARDGFYFSSSESSDIRKIAKKFNFDRTGIKSFVYGCVGSTNYGLSSFTCIHFVFDDKSSAKDCFEDYSEYLIDKYVDSDDNADIIEEDDDLLVIEGMFHRYPQYIDLYNKGNTVTFVYLYNKINEDVADDSEDFYDYIGRELPSDR